MREEQRRYVGYESVGVILRFPSLPRGDMLHRCAEIWQESVFDGLLCAKFHPPIVAGVGVWGPKN